MTELMNKLAPHITINYLGHLDPKDRIPDDGHSLNSKEVQKIVNEWVYEHDPEGFQKVTDYTSKKFIDSIKRTPPFVVLLMAAGKFDAKAYNEMLLSVPADQEIVCHCVPSEKVQEYLYEAYEMLAAAKTAAPEVVEEPVIGGLVLQDLKGEPLKMVNAVLTGYGNPTYEDIKKMVSSASHSAKTIADMIQKVTEKESKFDKDMKARDKIISKLQDEIVRKDFVSSEVVSDGVIPNGKIVMKDISLVFPGVTSRKFEVPVWVWDGPHPDVPQADPDYIFREDLLIRALYAIISNQRMYLQGHTGSGKTTLVEQIAAALNWPFMRINFDSEITRMDLIGRDTLKDGASVFVDGILPRMMQSPYIGVFDEIDFCRPDVAYVMQSVLEGSSFRITEDGGRLVSPHPMFRMFATGNTVGQGDEHGMYQGARPQSLAFLDRFTVWGKVPYLKEEERKTLIERKVPTLKPEEVTIINKYATEHLVAFESAKVLQPISPRGILAVGKALSYLNTVSTDKGNLKEALTMVVLDRCTTGDYAVLKGIIDRVCK